MPFPISTEGFMQVSGLSPDRALDLIQPRLAGVKPTSLVREAASIEFRVRSPRPVTNWNLLTPVSSGRIEVASFDGATEVRYQVRLTGALARSLAIPPIVAGILSLASGHPFLPLFAPIACVMAATFGATFALTRWRFSRFVQGALSGTGCSHLVPRLYRAATARTEASLPRASPLPLDAP